MTGDDDLETIWLSADPSSGTLPSVPRRGVTSDCASSSSGVFWWKMIPSRVDCDSL